MSSSLFSFASFGFDAERKNFIEVTEADRILM